MLDSHVHHFPCPVNQVASEFLPCSNAQVSPSSDDMSLVNPAELLNITGRNKSSIALKLFNVLSNTGAVQPSTSADVYPDQSIFGGPSHAFEPVTLDGADRAFGALSTFQPLDHEDGHVPVENDAVWDTSFTPGSPERVQYSVKIKAGMVSVSLSADHKHLKYACNVPQCNYSVPRLDDFYSHVHTKHEEVSFYTLLIIILLLFLMRGALLKKSIIATAYRAYPDV